MSDSRVSSHCSGIGPDQLILKGFLRAAIHALGLPFNCRLQHHFSVDTRHVEMYSREITLARLCGVFS